VSASSIARAASDPQLQSRIVAEANKEIIFNDELAQSWFGRQVRNGFANFISLYWAVAVETEASYETAVNSGRGAPGYDTDVITDAALTSAILANWPEDPNTLPPVPDPIP
jgi:hypothetical protein